MPGGETNELSCLAGFIREDECLRRILAQEICDQTRAQDKKQPPVIDHTKDYPSQRKTQALPLQMPLASRKSTFVAPIPCHKSNADFQWYLIRATQERRPSVPKDLQPICREAWDATAHLRRAMTARVNFTILSKGQVDWVVPECQDLGIVFGPTNFFDGPCPTPWLSPELGSLKGKVQPFFYLDGLKVFYLGEFYAEDVSFWYPRGVRYPGDPISLDAMFLKARERHKKNVNTRPSNWESHVRQDVLQGNAALDCVLIRRVSFDPGLYQALRERYQRYENAFNRGKVSVAY